MFVCVKNGSNWSNWLCLFVFFCCFVLMLWSCVVGFRGIRVNIMVCNSHNNTKKIEKSQLSRKFKRSKTCKIKKNRRYCFFCIFSTGKSNVSLCLFFADPIVEVIQNVIFITHLHAHIKQKKNSLQLQLLVASTLKVIWKVLYFLMSLWDWVAGCLH